eukprot:3696747-Rhodomonas_salina.1
MQYCSKMVGASTAVLPLPASQDRAGEAVSAAPAHSRGLPRPAPAVALAPAVVNRIVQGHSLNREITARGSETRPKSASRSWQQTDFYQDKSTGVTLAVEAIQLHSTGQSAGVDERSAATCRTTPAKEASGGVVRAADIGAVEKKRSVDA